MNQTVQVSKLHTFSEQLKPTNIALSEELVKTAGDQLSEMDFPTTRVEDWKYTRVTKISNLELSEKNGKATRLATDSLVKQDVPTIVFENGFVNHTLSTVQLPHGVFMKAFSDCTAEELNQVGTLHSSSDQVFSLLNVKYLQDGILMTIEDNVQLEEPIQFIQLITENNVPAFTRLFISVGKNSKAEFIHLFLGANTSDAFTNHVSEIKVGPNANFTFQKLQNENGTNFHISREVVLQKSDSTFTINTMTLDGAFVRNDLNIAVDGSNCTTNLNGAYVLKNNQHVDNHTVVDHKKPHCESNELYKGVMDEKSTAVFNGKVFVRQDAQKINAFQSNGNVLLSDDATINSKPELEIYADDVKCSHGSTTGQLDDEAVFYLQARGISKESAKNLLVSAFVGEVLEKIEDEDVANYSAKILNQRFGWEY